MAGGTGKLTALAIKAAKPAKHFDGGGLSLDVRPTGSRYWRMKYRFGGRESLLAFGVHPEVSLPEARDRREEARRLLPDGVDLPPAETPPETPSAARWTGPFKVVAEAWLEARKANWAPETYRKAKYVVDTYLVPKLGKTSIASVTSAKAVDAVEEIARGTPSLASKARNYLTGIVTYAIRKRLR
jgi:hypothetical protein